jgi:hypothetical protein
MKSILLILLLAVPGQAPPVATDVSKLQWGMTGPDLNSVQGYMYKWYLDGSATGNQFSGVLCTGATPNFNCQVMFPPMTQGNHVIRLSASNAGGEGELSDPFAFSFVGNPPKPFGISIIPK